MLWRRVRVGNGKHQGKFLFGCRAPAHESPQTHDLVHFPICSSLKSQCRLPALRLLLHSRVPNLSAATLHPRSLSDHHHTGAHHHALSLSLVIIAADISLLSHVSSSRMHIRVSLRALSSGTHGTSQKHTQKTPTRLIKKLSSPLRSQLQNTNQKCSSCLPSSLLS